jgi:hypothetical protein
MLTGDVMKATKPNPVAVQMLLIAVCVILTVGRPAQAQTDGYLLMVQQSPLDAGIVTPQTGIYRTPLNDTITLSAVPNTGFRFVCWLGDVIEPTANSTTIVVDAPKIVIAVFEREEFETLSEEGLLVPGQGYTGLRRSPSSVRFGAGVSPGEPKIYDTPDRRWQNGDDGQVDDFPVPDDGDDDDFPVPEVPEPATLLIFGSGTLGVLFMRRRFAR